MDVTDRPFEELSLKDKAMTILTEVIADMDTTDVGTIFLVCRQTLKNRGVDLRKFSQK